MKTEEQKKIEKKERYKKYYEANKKEISIRNIKYQKEHPEQKSKANMKWIKNNLERVKKNNKNYIQNHKNELNDRNKEWQRNNQDKVKATRKEYYQNHKKAHQEQTKKWKLEHPERVLEHDKKCHSKRNRNLGFKSINDHFLGSHGHHINKVQIIYIPEEIHQIYPHALKRPESMIEINRIAFDFLTNNIKQI